MKAWQKGTIVGGLWGLISTFGFFEPQIAPAYTAIIALPAFVSIVILSIINIEMLDNFLILISVIIGAFIGYTIANIYSVRKKGINT